MYQFDTSNLRDFGLPRPRASTIARLNEKARLRREAAEREAAAREASRLESYRRQANEAIEKGRAAARRHHQNWYQLSVSGVCVCPDLLVVYERARSASEPPSLREILEYVAEKHAARGVTPDEIKSERRHQSLCIARQEFCWMARHYCSRSLPAIGQFINRDHTTVLHNVKRHQARIDAGEVEADRTFER